MNKQIKAIIFDVGRVLFDWDNSPFWNGLGLFSKYSVEDIKDRVRGNGVIMEYHHGKISTQEFYVRVINEIDADGLKFETFCDLWNTIMTTPNEPIERILGAIKEEIKLLILSDTTELHWQLINKSELIKRFFLDKKQAILSFEVGASKPAEKIYKEAVKRAGCLFEECIFIDDIKENTEQFQSLGGNGIIYDCRIDTIEDLQNKLSTYNIFK